MIFNKVDLSQFVKTKLAQEMQKAQIGNYVKKKGSPPLVSTVQKGKPGVKSKTSNGIDLGHQIEPGVIPIIYGHVGMSNTQFDLGQKPSDVDAKFVTQEIKFPVSEGPIAGLSFRSDLANSYDPDNEYYYLTQSPDANNPNHFKNIVLNDSFVVDPITKVANFKDVKFEMTFGDGTTNKQSGEIKGFNPILFEEDDEVEIDSQTDATDEGMKLNDLEDVNAASGSRHVVYWNTESAIWEAKSFNDLLNETGATYDGGAGGSGGTGGSGGAGGVGGTGGVGPGTGLIAYTQWNPPPVHTKIPGDAETTITVTAPGDPGKTSVSGAGAPLRWTDLDTPYFSTTINFADVDKKVDEIALNFTFPDGFYKEITRTRTAKDGTTIEVCGTERPISDSGDLNCLKPVIAVADDLSSVTEKSRVSASVRINYALTTTICNREFILHDGYQYIYDSPSSSEYKSRHAIRLNQMNAGYARIFSGPNRGYTQDGPLDGDTANASCNSTDLQSFDFFGGQNWGSRDWSWDGAWWGDQEDYHAGFVLADYLAAYPDDIVKAAHTVKVYAWVDNKYNKRRWFGLFGGDASTYKDEEFTCSTNAYLSGVDVCKTFTDFQKDYNRNGLVDFDVFRNAGPNHNHNWNLPWNGTWSTHTSTYALEKARCYKDIISADPDSYADTKGPDPLVVDDGVTLGSTGTVGSTGSGGGGGTSGSAGSSGSVTVPTAPAVPSVSMSGDATYSGDGNSDTVTLPSISVSNPASGASNDLVISLSGSVGASVDVNTLSGGVSKSGGGTAEMTLTGTASDLQTTLDSGVVFTSSTGTRGDITIDLEITSPVGSSKDSKKIHPEAATEYTSPIFEFYISTAATGNIKATVNGRKIMNQIATSGTINDIAAACAQAINDYTSKPDWTAVADGNKVTGVGEAGIGDSLNGVIVENEADSPLAITTLDLPASAIKQGVAPSRTSQPVRNESNIQTDFVPATSFTNTLDASDVAWLQLKYRPKQEDGVTDLSEVGVYVAGREIFDVAELAVPYSLAAWKLLDYDTSVIQYSNNPAWIFFDYLTNTRYGLGNDIKLTDSQKDAIYADIYYASWWCLVAPIAGNTTQRVATFNGVFYGAESKYEALQKIADSFQGKFVYINGNPRLIFDGQGYSWSATNQSGSATINYQAQVNHAVNQSNSADLTYQSGSIENLFNVINVKWNNPENHHRQEEVQYKNSASITKYGERETTVELTGCTSKQQALWYGAWLYETEASNSEMVTYIAGWDHYSILPGMLLHIADTLRVDQTETGGRVSAVNGGTLTIDRDIGASTNVVVIDSNGDPILGTGSGTTLTMPGSYTYEVGAVFNTYSGTFEPTHRVVAIEESEDGIYAVTAQKFDADKYTRIWANTV